MQRKEIFATWAIYLWHFFTPEVNPRHPFCFPFCVLSRVTSAITFSSWRTFHFAATIPKTASKWPWQSTTDSLKRNLLKLQLHTKKSPQGATRSSYTIDSALTAANPSGVNLRTHLTCDFFWTRVESVTLLQKRTLVRRVSHHTVRKDEGGTCEHMFFSFSSAGILVSLRNTRQTTDLPVMCLCLKTPPSLSQSQ